jgi:hypothetical protein
MAMRKNKKGLFFTFIAILMSSLLILLFMSQQEIPVTSKIPAIKSRINLLNNYVEAIEDVYFERIVKTSTFRAMQSLSDNINATGKFFRENQSINDVFTEALLYGTANPSIPVWNSMATRNLFYRVYYSGSQFWDREFPNSSYYYDPDEFGLFSNKTRLAQAFYPSVAGYLKRAEFTMSFFNGTPTEIIVEVRFGSPTGTLLGTGTISPFSFISFKEAIASFSGIYLDAKKLYYFVIYSSDDENHYYWLGKDTSGNPYTGDSYSSTNHGQTWVASAQEDYSVNLLMDELILEASMGGFISSNNIDNTAALSQKFTVANPGKLGALVLDISKIGSSPRPDIVIELVKSKSGTTLPSDNPDDILFRIRLPESEVPSSSANLYLGENDFGDVFLEAGRTYHIVVSAECPVACYRVKSFSIGGGQMISSPFWRADIDSVTGKDYMTDYTIEAQLEELSEMLAQEVKVDAEFTNHRINISQDMNTQAWNVRVVYLTDMMFDGGLASWNKTIKINTTVDIMNLSDPWYMGNAHFNNPISVSPYDEWGSVNTKDHLDSMTYKFEANAPTILMRFKNLTNSTNASQCCGMESLMNPVLTGVPLRNISYVDYCYWSDACVGEETTYGIFIWKIQGITSTFYPWFRLDSFHKTEYGVDTEFFDPECRYSELTKKWNGTGCLLNVTI